ncbi:MAG: GntR family transcriptional regulator [Planctomycetes bacterium]|nr:GntR family transcriptional regulator [Planctomycetota bacterium]
MTRQDKAQNVLEQLLRRIVAGDWSAPGELPPIRCLERQLGTSRVTLIEALRRAAAEGVIRQRAKRPATLAPDALDRCRRLLGRMHTDKEQRRVAVLVPEAARFLRFDFRDVLRRHLVGPAAERNIDVEILSWPDTGQREFVENLVQEGFGATVAMGIRAEHLLTLHLLRQHRFPVLLFNRVIPDLPFPSLLLDEYEASQHIAAELVALGHRNLCLVYPAFDERIRIGQHRVNGWIDYLKRERLLDQCSLPVYYLTPRDDVNLFAPPLRLKNRPTAIVFGFGSLWDQFAAAYPTFPFRVPEDVSLATFDIIYRAAQPSWCPSVTSLSENPDHTAAATVDMLDKMLSGQLRPENVILHLEMAHGPSIGPAPN